MTKWVGLILLLVAAPLAAETITYRVLFAGDDVGHMIVNEHDNQLAIDFDYKQNGRGLVSIRCNSMSIRCRREKSAICRFCWEELQTHPGRLLKNGRGL